MSEAIDTTIENAAAAEFVRPGSEQDVRKGPIPKASDVRLDEINPVWNRLFSENRMLEYFERLRREDPVHFMKLSAVDIGPLARYDEIKAVDTDRQELLRCSWYNAGFSNRPTAARGRA